MKPCLDIAGATLSAPSFATWIMRSPLVPVEMLIGVVLVCCVLLFWVRSSIELRRQQYDRLYGPGMKAIPFRWWEADLDPIFNRWVDKFAAKWLRK